jgi:hypothetical protein
MTTSTFAPDSCDGWFCGRRVGTDFVVRATVATT